MIRRKIEREIEAWHRAQINEALLIDGARQVGKTFIIREFGKHHFELIWDFVFPSISRHVFGA